MRLLAVLLTTFLALLGPATARAQDEPATDPTAPASTGPAEQADDLGARWTEAAIQGRIDAFSADGEISPDETALAEAWKAALIQVRARDEATLRSEKFLAERTDVPAHLETTRAALARPPVPLPDLGGVPLTELESRLIEARIALDDATKRVADLAAERSLRRNRRTEGPKLIASARERLTELETPESPPTDPKLAEAATALRLVSQEALREEIRAVEAERDSYDARTELLAAREDLANLQLSEATAVVEVYQAVVDAALARQRDQAAREVEQTRQATQDSHPAVRALADANAAVLIDRDEVAELSAGDKRRLAELTAELGVIKAQRDQILSKVERVGYTNAIAALLRKQRASLADYSTERREMARRDALVSEVDSQLFELQEERASLTNLDRYVASFLADYADTPLPESERDELIQLATTRRDLLDAATTDVLSYFNQLVEVDTAQKQLIATTNDYAKFIDERILWLRSNDPLNLNDFRESWTTTQGLGPAIGEMDIAGAFYHQLDVQPGTTVFLGLITLLLLLLRPWSRRRLTNLCTSINEARISSSSETLGALFQTLVLTALLPMLILFAGFVLAGEEDLLSATLGAILPTVALFMLPISLMRTICRPAGLGIARLRWSQDACRLIRRSLLTFGVIAGPTLLLALLGDATESGSAQGRIAMLLVDIATIVLLIALLRPGSVILKNFRAHQAGTLLARLYPLWLAVAIAMPAALGIALVFGYQYAAFRLGIEMFETWTLILVVIVGHSIAMRWLAMAKRAARLELARKKREALEAGAAPEGGEAPLAEELDGSLDIVEVDAQARRLVNAITAFALVIGLSALWSDTLPALSALDDVRMWETTVEAPLVADDGTTVSTSFQLRIVSLTDVLLALVLVLITVSATRNIPGLLDLTIMRNIGVAPNVSYAIATLVRYALTVLGILLVADRLGVSWGKVQWLVAAMGFGLGFGLQEVFANLVCGIILLFESRIRLGDIVTVGDVSGTVTKIRVLATTVRNWDRHEFVVPNKELITGRLLNWTLTDQTTRVLLQVGVAYGTDTKAARELLLSVAANHPVVLDDPAPMANFELFDDSTLNLSLRAYLPNLDNKLTTVTELNEAIDAAFKQAGIEIAFPQRDLHLRTAPAALRVEERERDQVDRPPGV